MIPLPPRLCRQRVPRSMVDLVEVVFGVLKDADLLLVLVLLRLLLLLDLSCPSTP